MTEPLKAWLEADGRLLRLRLARPKANLIDATMIAALATALDAHLERPSLSAVLLDAEGPNFSFGASVEEHLPGACAAMLASLHGLLGRMLESPVPILVAVHGRCLGGGLELALAGQLLFVSPDAELGQPVDIPLRSSITVSHHGSVRNPHPGLLRRRIRSVWRHGEALSFFLSRDNRRGSCVIGNDDWASIARSAHEGLGSQRCPASAILNGL